MTSGYKIRLEEQKQLREKRRLEEEYEKRISRNGTHNLLKNILNTRENGASLADESHLPIVNSIKDANGMLNVAESNFALPQRGRSKSPSLSSAHKSRSRSRSRERNDVIPENLNNPLAKQLTAKERYLARKRAALEKSTEGVS